LIASELVILFYAVNRHRQLAQSLFEIIVKSIEAHYAASFNKPV